MTDQVKTVADIFLALEEEIQAAKKGELPLDAGRVAMKGRSLQLKAAELNLQFLRLNRAQSKKHNGFNLLTGQSIDGEETQGSKSSRIADLKSQLAKLEGEAA